MEIRSYDSRTYSNPYCKGNAYQLPNFYGHVEDTELFFVAQKVYARILEQGSVTFLDENRSPMAHISVKANTKNGRHENVFCKGQDGCILLWFPVVDYVDNYPYCDGEYDRWDVVCTGYIRVTFRPGDCSFEQTRTKDLD